MGKTKTQIIYFVKDDQTAKKIEGDDVLVYEKIISVALGLLEKHDPDTFEIFKGIKPQKVRIRRKIVPAKEFDKNNEK